MSEPSPYAILVTCLQKNYGLGDTNIETTMTPARNQRNEFKMKVNEREVSECLF
jgi:microprocessor complex subunit DGCR8